MYKIEKRTRTWFDRSVDGMDFEDSFVILDVNGNEIAEVDSEKAAQRLVRQLKGEFDATAQNS